MKTGVFFLGLLTGCALPEADTGSPAEPLVQDLFFGETPQPTGTGGTQLTARGLHEDFGAVEQTEMAARLELGMTESFDLRVLAPYRFVSRPPPAPDTEGFGNVAVGLLYNLPDTSGWLVSATFDVGLGNADEQKGLGRDETELRPAFLASRRLGDYEALLGLGGVFADGDTDVDYFAALVRGAGRVRGVLELSGVTRERTEDLLRLTPGLVWQEPGGFELGVGAPIGLDRDAANWGVVVQMSVQM